MKKVHLRLSHVIPDDRWANPFPPAKQIDKVGIARAVCESWIEEEFPDDLKRQIRRLVNFINSANAE